MSDAEQTLGIYHLDRIDSPEYGCYTSMVVIAESEMKARLQAGWAASTERNNIAWADSSTTTANRIGYAVDGAIPHIVLSVKLGE